MGRLDTHLPEWNCKHPKLQIWDDRSNVVKNILLHTSKVIVWYGFTAEIVIGQFFYENFTPDKLITCSLTGEKYRDMLRIFTFPAFQHRNCFKKLFSCKMEPLTYCCTSTAAAIQTFTTESVISRYFPTEWPSWSPDLSPCDFWLQGNLKSKVYQGIVEDLAALKDNITRIVRKFLMKCY